MAVVHFVGFTPEQIRRWGKVFESSAIYIHDKWDVRAEQEYAPGDRIIYANNTPRRAEERDFFLGLPTIGKEDQ